MRDSRSLLERGLPILTWGLTFHILAIALLFGVFHVPAGVVRGIAAWKETFGVVAIALVVAHAATGQGPRVRIVMADMLAGGWLALAIVFLVTENTVLRNSVPPFAAVLGVRDAAFFVLFYFVGRATPGIGRDDRVLKRSFTVLAVVSAIAILEQIFVTPRMLVAMGVASYVNDFLGTPGSTAGNVYRLPDNYWSMMGGHMVRRSGSVFLSGQGFATPFLILLPAATMWVFGRERSPGMAARLGYLIVWLGLTLSFTRSVIVICAVQALVLFVYLRRPTAAATLVASGVAAVLLVAAAFPGVSTFIFETITWQTGSSASHLKDWTAGITAFFERPLGYGLGTTDQTAQRAGLTPLTYDNLFLKYAVEMGVAGVVVLVGALVAILAASVRLMRAGSDHHQRAFGAAVALATFGIAVDGMTSAVFNNPIVAYLFFWYAGAAVTLSER